MRVNSYIQLITYDNFFAGLLVFFPCLFTFINHEFFDIVTYGVFLYLSFFILSIGAAINNIFSIRKDVLKTKMQLNLKDGITKLQILTLLIVEFGILYFFNKEVIFAVLICNILMFIFPIFKKNIYLSSIFLSLLLNFGAIVTPLYLKNTINFNDLLIYLGSTVWTIIYITFYNFSDFSDNYQDNLKTSQNHINVTQVYAQTSSQSSSSFQTSKNIRFTLNFLYIINILSLSLFLYGKNANNNIVTNIFIAIYFICTYWEVYFFDINLMDDGLIRFKFNIFIGFLIAIILI